MDLLPASTLRPTARAAGSHGAADRQATESHATVPGANAVPQFSGWTVGGVKAADAARPTRPLPFRPHVKNADLAEPVSAETCDPEMPGSVGGSLDRLA